MRRAKEIRAERIEWRALTDELCDRARYLNRLGRQCLVESRTTLAIIKLLHPVKNQPSVR